MNLSNQPKNHFLVFLKSLGIGLYTYLLLLVACMVVVLFFKGFELKNIEIWLTSKSGMIIATVIQFLTLFILPAFAYIYFINENLFETFRIKKKDSLYKYVLAILIVISLFPLLISIEGLIEKIPFSNELLLKAELQKKNLEAALNLILDDTSIFNFFIVFILMSLLAGFSEELFFRGLLLNVLINHTNYIIFGIIFGISFALVFEVNMTNIFTIITLATLSSFLVKNAGIKHREYIAVIVCSFLFAAMHFNIYNFIPILIAGLIFGLIALKTKNLKITILMHAFFNGMQLILHYLYTIKLISVNLEEEKHFPISLLIACFFVLSFSLYFIIRPNEHLPHAS